MPAALGGQRRQRQEVRRARHVVVGDAARRVVVGDHLRAQPGRRRPRPGDPRARRGDGERCTTRTDGVRQHPRRPGGRRPDGRTVEQRPHPVVAADEQPRRRRDVGRAHACCCCGGQPSVPRPRRTPGPRGRPEVVPGRRLRLARRPLGVEVVVVGADHVHRAVQGAAAADAARGVDVLLALEVGDVAVAARQDGQRTARPRPGSGRRPSAPMSTVPRIVHRTGPP